MISYVEYKLNYQEVKGSFDSFICCNDLEHARLFPPREKYYTLLMILEYLRERPHMTMNRDIGRSRENTKDGEVPSSYCRCRRGCFHPRPEERKKQRKETVLDAEALHCGALPGGQLRINI